MIRFNRPQCPQNLANNQAKWTKQYLHRIKHGKGTFFWNTVNESKVNHDIIDSLLVASDAHCAYCDKYPLFRSDETIDHFMPKAYYKFAAYQWENLFPACDNCQTEKGDNFSNRLIKPDEKGYSFSKYFILDFTTFKILVNPKAYKSDRKRAYVTIQTFNLNHKSHCVSRRHQFERFTILGDKNPIDDYAYRYMFM